MNADKIFEKIAELGNKILFFDILHYTKIKASMPFLIFWLLFASLYFSIVLRFLNFKSLFKVLCIFLKEKSYVDKKHNLASTKSIILSATGGATDLGSIFGVATIVAIGGPGTIFWLIFAGIISTSIRFVEVFCGHKFRKKIYINGEHKGYNGGPQIYIKKAFTMIKLPRLGRIFAKIFAFNVTISTFCSLQINQTVHVITHTMPFMAKYDWIISLTISIIVISIVVRGISSLAKFSKTFVPIMLYLYFLITMVVIVINYDKIIPTFIIVIKDAISFRAINGGFLGSMILGVQRAFFCNESGAGSGAIIHSSSDNKDSYKEAMLSIITPIISVLIVCFCSGLIVLLTGVYNCEHSGSGIDFIMKAFAEIHPKMQYVTLIIVPLFGITTAASWAYYGSRSWQSVFGKNVKVYYCLLFVAYFLCGIVKNFETILNVADILNLSITIPNITSLIILSNFIRKALKKERKKRL
jgi:AGCS family alanine or glycine:cation symporter